MPVSFDAASGQQQFLQLLVAQLMYQNPLQPVEQQDFLSQLAQFSVLDGVERMNLRFDDLIALQSLSQGTSFIGRYVEYTSPITEELAIGRVEATRVINGSLVTTIDGQQVPLSAISAVLADPPTTPQS